MRMQGDLLDMVYPIGRGFIDFTDTDYSRYLGFTWERELLGMFPLGADDTNYPIDTTGGSSTKTISKDNLPNYDLTVTDEGHKHNATGVNYSSDYGAQPSLAGKGQATATMTTDTAKTGIKVNSGGKGSPLNIMPPYKTVYYWKRVA